jgi:DNA-binding transcriptional MerR regulator
MRRTAPLPDQADRTVSDREAVTHTIGELSREFGCTTRALRYYEYLELLSPMRLGQHRVYSYRDRARLQLILRGKRLRLKLEEIRQILELYEGPRSRLQDKVTFGKYHERIIALEVQREEIDEAITELEVACEELERRLRSLDRPR